MIPGSRTGRHRFRGLTVAAVAAALVLTGCVSWFQPPTGPRTSTPTDERVEPELRDFYRQVLEWSGCGNGMQCATAEAPLDWGDPGGDRIDLALIRQAATGNRLGSLLVNPGGPGGSGYDFVRDSVDYATSERLQSSYDIIGFDPRGVGRSTPVRCYEDPTEFDDYIYGISPGEPGTDEWIAAARAGTQEFASRCLELTGPLLGHVDTVSAARDLDMLRAALGDSELNYLGYSYGTYLGATYADLFPEKTGRLVLDGAIDPTTSDFDVTATQAQGFESAFRAYLEDCLAARGCPFRGSVDRAMDQTRALFESLNRSPLAGADGRELSSSAMFTAIIFPLYSQETWPYLDDLFAEVFAGRSDMAFQLADSYYEREPDGTYANNSTEAFISINCLDYAGDADPARLRADAAELEELAPTFGPEMSYGGIGCADWPFPATRDREPIVAEGSADILVVGTTNDPATPYVWAEALAEQLENGHLVTFEGEGHTAYNKSNSCINDTVDGFFVDGAVPDADPRC